MARTRVPLRRVCTGAANIQRNRPGPKPKSIEERTDFRVKPLQRVERSYTRERKIQVLCFLYHYRISYITEYGEEVTREVHHSEASSVFLIPRSTITTWWNNRDTILNTQMGKRYMRTAYVCYWPEVEEKLFQAFVERRDQGKTVRRGWFRRVSKRIFRECYPQLDASLFCFSAGWFHGFISRHHITLRFTTNKAQRVPADYIDLVLSWLRFNRRNSQPRPYIFLETVLTRDVGRYLLSNICNLDETPLPFKYLDGRTYSLRGLKTIWAKSTKSGWDKRQATLILCIFADGISRIPPLIIFHGKGTLLSERPLYDPRVIVEFNPTAYNNQQLFLKYIDLYLLPALEQRPSLFAFDSVDFHKTPAVLDKLQQHDIIPSIIPPGCTNLVQPLDISVNRPLKDMLQDLTDEAIDRRGQEEDKWTVSERRVLTTKCVGQAWENFCTDKRDIIIKSFRNVGLSLPIDGSCDDELDIKEFSLEELRIGDWTLGNGNGNPTVEEQLSLGHSISENTVIPPLHDESLVVEYL